jgi:hypothetical protein
MLLVKVSPKTAFKEIVRSVTLMQLRFNPFFLINKKPAEAGLLAIS